MKKAGYILFTALFFIMCALPVLAMPLLRREGEAQAAPPKLYTAETGVNSGFGEEMETYLTENFAGREQLVTFNAKLTGAVFATSAERQVILGEDGWLFFDQTLQDYLGTHPLTEGELADLATTMALVQEYADAQGSDFLFTVAPNKNSLYGEYMPYYTVPAQAENDLVGLADAMDERGVKYFDLYELMDGEEGLYHKRDTHWNNAGARLAYDEMLNTLGQPHKSFDGPFEITGDWEGDLDRMIYPVNGAPDEQVVYEDGPENDFEYQGPARVELSQVETTSTNGRGSLLFFRDSFGNAILPFFSTAYAEATYLQATPHTPDQLEPGQTLIIEIVQRNLRVLLANAPRMPAPERAFEGEVERVPGGNKVLVSEETGDYLKVYGAIDEELAEGADALMVAVQQGDEITYYEAFPAFDAGLSEEGISGQGYTLYIPKAELPGGDFELFPVVQFKNLVIIIG